MGNETIKNFYGEQILFKIQGLTLFFHDLFPLRWKLESQRTNSRMLLMFFVDNYIRKIGHATENEAKLALFHILYRMYAKDKGLGEDALDDDTAKLAAAVTNKVFGERGSDTY